MSLLREIQQDLSTKDGDLPTVLRKCKILAARLGSDDFAHWVDWELNGYPDGEPTPPYRRLISACYANFVNAGWQANKQPIPWAVFPADIRDNLEHHEFRGGIASITSFVSGGCRVDLPQLTFKIQGKVFPGMNCVGVWLITDGSEFEQLVSAVKNRILDFALKIETANPDAGEAPLNTRPIPADKLQPIVQNFFAPVGNVAQASHHVQQAATINVSTSDLKTLVSELSKHLSELGLAPAQEKIVRTQLSTIDAQVNGEPDPTVITHVGRTIRNVTEGAIGSLLATAAQPAVWHWIHDILAKF